MTKAGSKVVYHPNIEGLAPISLEKEHGSREFMPPRYAKFAIQGIDDLISYIETHPDVRRAERDGEQQPDELQQNDSSEVPNAGTEESGLLPKPKIPDRNS